MTSPTAIPNWGQSLPDLSDPTKRPPIITRTYKGKPEQANAAFMAEAAQLGSFGYRPISQQYVPGSWGAGAFIIALLLFIVLVGILVFIYMLLVKPAGTLTVTYQLQA